MSRKRLLPVTAPTLFRSCALGCCKVALGGKKQHLRVQQSEVRLRVTQVVALIYFFLLGEPTMSFVWTCVSASLAAELALLALLVIPFPWGVRKNISRFVLHPPVRPILDTSLRYVGFGLVVAVIESINSMARLSGRLKELREPGDVASGVGSQAGANVQDIKLRRALCQRNFYMASFSIVLILTLQRLVVLVCNEADLRAKIKSLNGNKPIDDRGNEIPERSSAKSRIYKSQ